MIIDYSEMEGRDVYEVVGRGEELTLDQLLWVYKEYRRMLLDQADGEETLEQIRDRERFCERIRAGEARVWKAKLYLN